MESLPIGAPASLAGTLAAVATAAARPLLVLGVVVAFFSVPALKKLWKKPADVESYDSMNGA